MSLTHKQHITALGKLMRYAANKRFALIENDFSNDSLAEAAKKINEEISRNLGIDIFYEERAEKILEYEEQVYRRLTSYTSENIPIKLIDKEIIDIRKNSTYVSQSYLANLKINQEYGDSFKEYLKKLGLTSSLSTYFRTCDYAMLYRFPGNSLRDIYFVTTKGRIKNKERILLMIVSHGKGRKTYSYSSYGHTIKEDVSLVVKDELSIPICFIFQLELFEQYLTNPINLFLFCLEKYGLDINIMSRTKRFFRNEILPNEHLSGLNLHKYLVNTAGKSDYYVYVNVDKKQIGVEVSNFFAIDITKYLADLIRFRI